MATEVSSLGSLSHHDLGNYMRSMNDILSNQSFSGKDLQSTLSQITNGFSNNERIMSVNTNTCQAPPSDTSPNEDAHSAAAQAALADARRMRKSVYRRTIDYNAPLMNHLEDRVWQKDFARDAPALQADYLYQAMLRPSFVYQSNAYTSITAKHVRTSTNKNKCPIYCLCWTPEGRRLVTGGHSGEFTLWNGLTFNFETILQAHEHPIRAMKWTNNEDWLVTADQHGFVKYWQTNMNNVTAFSAHKESAIRGISFCPTDDKFVTCSDDATVRVWDFYTHAEERVLRGHGADVRCVAWHPQASLVISGSKDAQQPIKLWDPKTGESVLTLYAHKSTCTDITWNKNGNWFITSSRDHLIKLFDIRQLKQPMETYRGHKRDVMRLAWHPFHETLFTSGSGDGAILFWLVGNEKNVGSIDDAHESMIWSLAWHPLGHILVSGANDFTTKFWTRNRPGDMLRDTSSLQSLQTSLLQPHDSSIVARVTNARSDVAVNKITSNDDSKEHISTEKEPDSLMLDGTPWPELPNIPGIGDGQVMDHNRMETNFDEHERIRTLRANRAIPKQFMMNWASAKHASMPSAMGVSGSGGMNLIGSAAAGMNLIGPPGPGAPAGKMLPPMPNALPLGAVAPPFARPRMIPPGVRVPLPRGVRLGPMGRPIGYMRARVMLRPGVRLVPRPGYPGFPVVRRLIRYAPGMPLPPGVRLIRAVRPIVPPERGIHSRAEVEEEADYTEEYNETAEEEAPEEQWEDYEGYEEEYEEQEEAFEEGDYDNYNEEEVGESDYTQPQEDYVNNEENMETNTPYEEEMETDNVRVKGEYEDRAEDYGDDSYYRENDDDYESNNYYDDNSPQYPHQPGANYGPRPGPPSRYPNPGMVPRHPRAPGSVRAPHLPPGAIGRPVRPLPGQPGPGRIMYPSRPRFPQPHDAPAYRGQYPPRGNSGSQPSYSQSSHQQSQYYQ